MFIAITVEIYRNKGSVGVKLILTVKKNIWRDNPSYRPRNAMQAITIKWYKMLQEMKEMVTRNFIPPLPKERYS